MARPQKRAKFVSIRLNFWSAGTESGSEIGALLASNSWSESQNLSANASWIMAA